MQTNTNKRVDGMLFQVIWYNNISLVVEFNRMESKGGYGMYQGRLQSIRGVIIYVDMMYRDINTYLKNCTL